MMPHYVDPKRFIDQPMVLKSSAAGEVSVMMNGLRAGRILLQRMPGLRMAYVWSLTSPVMAGITSSGEQETLEQAKAEIRLAFHAWLKWALEQEKSIVWNG